MPLELVPGLFGCLLRLSFLFQLVFEVCILCELVESTKPSLKLSEPLVDSENP